MPRKKKEDWSKLPEEEVAQRMMHFIQVELPEKLKDPKYLRRRLWRCGYRKRKNGEVYVIPRPCPWKW